MLCCFLVISRLKNGLKNETARSALMIAGLRTESPEGCTTNSAQRQFEMKLDLSRLIIIVVEQV